MPLPQDHKIMPQPRIGTETMLSMITHRVRNFDDLSEQIRALIEFAMEHYHSYPLYAKAAAQEAMRLLGQNSNKYLTCHALYASGLSSHALCQYSEALDYLYKMLNLAEFINDCKISADACYGIGINYERLREYPRALQYLYRAMNSFYEMEMLPELRRTYHAMGWVLESAGNIQRAIEFHTSGLQISHMENLPSAIAESHHSIAAAYGILQEFDKALVHFTECKILRQSIGDQFGKAVADECIGSILQKQSNYSGALNHYREALAIFEAFDNISVCAHTQSKIGMLLLEIGKYPEAIEHLLNARNLADAIGKTSMYGSLLYGIAVGYNAIHEFHRAYEYALLGLTDAEDTCNLNLKHQIHLLCSEISKNIGDIERAFEHFRNFHVVKELSHNIEKERLVSAMQTRFETDLIYKEKEDYRQRVELLAKDVEIKNKEITMLSLHLNQKNEAIGKIYNKMSNLQQDSTNTTSYELKNITRDMRSILNSEHTWKMFEFRFSVINHNFISRLSDKYRSLTPTELKICALLKMQLNNKEIADMLCVSLHNVEMHRYRIRKKLNLATSENLATFLTPL